MAKADLAVTLLRDTEHGGAADQPAKTAEMLAEFIAKATAALDVAIYDFKLGAQLAAPVVAAFKAAAGKKVKVRIGYDANKPAAQTIAAFEQLGGDPAPLGTEEWLKREFAATAIELKPIISPGSTLMHSKYIVRDSAAVWMGSANFTDGAWTRQENNILRFSSATLAKAYETDFQQLWQAGKITHTGIGDLGETTIAGVDVSWAFSPGEGTTIDSRLAAAASAAQQRIRVASMVLTSPALLDALAAAIDRGIDLGGVYDGGEMKGIAKEWAASSKDQAIVTTWAKVKAQLVAKPSASYSPTGPHDFMHNKILVSDELVVTGSYNFSKNAETNAENQVALDGAAIAQEYATYIEELVAQYS
jgi:phosphatidylserine/phosphatidylglycerophosphate/cardiolipin synthase-like enzyme